MIYLLLRLELGHAWQEQILGGLSPETDEAQWGVNAFLVVSCGFCLLLCHIFAAVKNKMYQWTDKVQSAGRERLHEQNFSSNKVVCKQPNR